MAKDKYGYPVEEQEIDGERVVRVQKSDGVWLVLTGDEYDEVIENAVDASSFMEGIEAYEAESAAAWQAERGERTARSQADDQTMETAAQEGTGEDNQQDQDPG